MNQIKINCPWMERSALPMLLGLILPWSSIQARASELDYMTLVQRVTEAHPEYQAMRSEIAAAEAAVGGALALPDPMLRLELMEIDNRNPRLLPGQVGSTRYTYEQMFPLWGKRGLKGEVAEANVLGVAAQSLMTLAELRAMLRMSFAELYVATQAQQINSEVLTLLGEMERNAQSRYANGLAAQQDVIKVKVEQTMVLVEQEMLAGEGEGARIAINSLTGALPDSFLPDPLTLPDTSMLLQKYAQLRQTGASETPVLVAAEASVKGRQAALDLAAREFYPDLTVGISPVQLGDRLGSWELMFEISVPLFASKRAMKTESVHRLASARLNRDAEILRVMSVAGQAVAAYTAALQETQLLEQQLRGETELNFRSALAGYQTGKVDFDTVIEAEQQIRRTRLLALAAVLKQQRAAARFEQVTGLTP